jgi:hypothetical protein
MGEEGREKEKGKRRKRNAKEKVQGIKKKAKEYNNNNK